MLLKEARCPYLRSHTQTATKCLSRLVRSALHFGLCCFEPFCQSSGAEPFQDGNWMPDGVVVRAKRSGQECAVTWAEVASQCAFETIADVNQALRLTGSKRLAPEYASKENTKVLVEHCREGLLYPPDEGCPSPPFEWSVGNFATAAGQHTLLTGDGFGLSETQLQVSKLIDPEQINAFAEFAAPDNSFYATIYTDYHTGLSARLRDHYPGPSDAFFEGFRECRDE